MELFLQADTWIALLTLTFLEIVGNLLVSGFFLTRKDVLGGRKALYLRTTHLYIQEGNTCI